MIKHKILLLLLLVTLLLMSGCQAFSGTEDEKLPQDSGGVEMKTTSEVAPTEELSTTQTLTPTMSKTPTTTATATPTEILYTPTITPTPWPITAFSSSALQIGVQVNTYLNDTCAYLDYRWGEDKSPPGTVVVPIMFHSVAQPGRTITDNTTISMDYYHHFIAYAAELGFETITMEELNAFLRENAKIPERSMLMILDDRRPGVTELFLGDLEVHDWTLTLAWPTTDETDDELWARMEQLAESGRLDIQSHGHDHIYIQWFTPLEEIEEEIYTSMDRIEAHFGTTPISIMWPGGNFTQEAVTMAKAAGYKLGFTAYSRGPLMFNWIPLGEPEMVMDDPLMVLPRYWSIGAEYALDHALQIAEAAKQNAEEVKEEELLYYALFCQNSQEE